jgi:hypothetical protein
VTNRRRENCHWKWRRKKYDQFGNCNIIKDFTITLCKLLYICMYRYSWNLQMCLAKYISLRQLIEYTDRQWMQNPIFDAASWSIYGLTVRTNNDVKGIDLAYKFFKTNLSICASCSILGLRSFKQLHAILNRRHCSAHYMYKICGFVCELCV